MAKEKERWDNTVTSMMRSLILETRGDEARQLEVGASLMAQLVGDPEPGVAPAKKTPVMAVKQKLFYGCIEIFKSLSALKNIETYLRVFPYARYGIKRSDHLAYHFENYLHEVYVLRERLKAYTTTVTRLYRKDKNAVRIKKAMDALAKAVDAALGPGVKARGVHVHQSRYEHSDLGRLCLIELFQKSPPSDEFEELMPGYYNSVYREIRTRWAKTIKESNANLDKFMVAYGKVMLDTIFTGAEDALAPPSNLLPG